MTRPKTIVLVEDDQGAIRGIGPVVDDEAVDEIREMAAEHGWDPYGEVTLESPAAFRRLMSRTAAA